MWDYSDYNEPAFIEETPHGVFRARVVLDEHPTEPDHDFGCPVLRLDPTGYGSARVDFTGYGSYSARHDGLKWASLLILGEFIDRFGWSDGTDVFDRYLRIFHGGSAVSWSGYGYSDYIYVAYDTRAMRETWGQTGESLETSAPEMTEWKGYVEGEVYGIVTERATAWEDDEPTVWEELESVWGFYGDSEYVKEEAEATVRHHIAAAAAEMLPINF